MHLAVGSKIHSGRPRAQSSVATGSSRYPFLRPQLQPLGKDQPNMQVPSQIRNENVNECDLVRESSTTECIQEHRANLQTDQSGNIQRSKEENFSISGLREYSRKNSH